MVLVEANRKHQTGDEGENEYSKEKYYLTSRLHFSNIKKI